MQATTSPQLSHIDLSVNAPTNHERDVPDTMVDTVRLPDNVEQHPDGPGSPESIPTAPRTTPATSRHDLHPDNQSVPSNNASSATPLPSAADKNSGSTIPVSRPDTRVRKKTIPDTIQIEIPSWFPFLANKNGFEQDGSIDLTTSPVPAHSTLSLNDEDSTFQEDLARLMAVKKPLITVNISEFDGLHLPHVKFIYRSLFKTAFHRYIDQSDDNKKKTVKDRSSSSPQLPFGRLDSSFSYAYFTPP